MGDYFERIVDLEVDADDAAATATRMVDWLVSRGLLAREMSGDGMYSLNVDAGYLPGPHWQQITQEWGEDWQPGPVAVIVGREAHHGGQGAIEPESAGCPSCGAVTVIIDYPQRFEPDPEVWRPFGEAIQQWKRTGAGTVACRRCQASSPITEWRWPSGFALGALAFDFWGWPPLTDAFVAEFAARLGHRVAHHTGKF
ncbi:hypothetical protein IU485_08010 [Nocardia cyriacigeorgica]|uniref:hypothetical protein n=1 Tax=Nocardia cyriacigeorgica TaxID=135487 RepID=UPI00189350A9|nr:hypothetical protein [Nocardia cyriacigeorgica]MBF6081302.1 hypothetical protein [Nocardia cyriacigeorgica]MBF6424146.1 hypothetical protein [Nocardia cyriacigeorgica]BDT88516.1 hypothetical protein FMUAM8_42800 [Nocardia cyriacigeorgica]